MTNKPNFRIMKNGYDRFAVDAEVERLTLELETTKQRIESYAKQVNVANDQLGLIKQRYKKLVDELSIKEKAADDISRLALKEANRVIDTAYHNADSIVEEALATAKMILLEVAKLSKEASITKKDMQLQLETLQEVLNDLVIPKGPRLDWLYDNEEQDKS